MSDKRIEIHETRIDALTDAIERLEETVEEQQDRIAELEELVNPDPADVEYAQLTKDQKVFKIRKHLIEDAAKTNGVSRMVYREIKALFDGHPSPGHCYDLMKQAAQVDGYEYDQAGGDGQKRVRVAMNAVKDETLIHAANKATGAKAL